MMRCAVRLFMSSRRVGHRFLDIIARYLFLLRGARCMRAKLLGLLQKKPVVAPKSGLVIL
jgi:hypothetical protein